MNRRALIGLVVVAVAALPLAVWLAGAGDTPAGPSAPDLHDQSSRRHNDPPLELPLDKAQPEPEPELPLPPQPSPEWPPLEPLPEPAEPTLHIADYGPALRRGGSVMDFELIDSHGSVMRVEDLDVKLWRKLGRYWIREGARVDAAAGRIVCDGLGGEGFTPSGLEPGMYQLEVRSSRWGSLTHKFEINGGELVSERIATQNWARVVCFRFVDTGGRPISHLPHPAHVVNTPPKTDPNTPDEPAERTPAPRDFLRHELTQPPPRRDRVSWGTDVGEISQEDETKKLYPTDAGRFYVRVYAGVLNTVTFPLDKEVWGVDEWTITDTFVGAQWDEYTVKLSVSGRSRMRRYGKEVEGFPPGNNDLVKTDPAIPVPVPPVAPVTEGRARLHVRLPRGYRPVAGRDQGRFEPVAAGDAVDWYAETKPVPIASVVYQYGNLFQSRTFELDLATGGLHRLDADLARSRLIIDTSRLSATTREFALGFKVDVAVRNAPGIRVAALGDEIILNPLIPRPAPPPKGFMQLGTAVSPRDASKRVEFPIGGRYFDNAGNWDRLAIHGEVAGACLLRTDKTGSSEQGPDGRYPYQPVIAPVFDHLLEFPRDGLEDELKLPIEPAGGSLLALRAVGPEQEGLPWVVAVVFPYRDDALARGIREIELKLAEQDARPCIDRDSVNDYAGKLRAVEGRPDPAEIKALMGETYDAFNDVRQRLWYARHNAWYDATNVLYSDEQGYALADLKLEPERVYVMYLWSNSRDDLHPDARLLFKTDAAATADLGAVELPAYKNE